MTDNFKSDGKAILPVFPAISDGLRDQSPIYETLSTLQSHNQPFVSDEDPPPYSSIQSGNAIDQICCRVCKQMIYFNRKLTNKPAVKCNNCQESTPISFPPPGKLFARCSCNCLVLCSDTDTALKCPRPNCQKILLLQAKRSAQAKVICTQCQRTLDQKDIASEQKDKKFDVESQGDRSWMIEADEVNFTDKKNLYGAGTDSEVQVAIFRCTHVAAKCMYLTISRHNRSIFEREIEISSRIHHPNIVQFIGATRTDIPILLYELMPTSLYKRLQNDQSLTRGQIISICCNICSALCYLHLWRPDPIIHRDISSPNVLLEPQGSDEIRAKLSDFGSANLQLHVKTVVPGNPAYFAPEAKFPDEHSPSMDIYSFGVLVTEMVLHRAPEIDISRRAQQVSTIDWNDMKNIVLRCISNERQQRPTAMKLFDELNKC